MSAAEQPEPGAPRPPSSASFAGDPRRAWSLARAVDALAQAARRAGRPGWIWLAGLGFPTVAMSLATGWGSTLFAWESAFGPGAEALPEAFFREATQALVNGLVGLPIFLIVLRLRVGLARIARPDIWDSLSEAFGQPRLRQAGRAGRGLTRSALGMSLMLSVMMSGVLILVVAPVVYFLAAVQENLGELAAIIGWLGLILPGVLLLTTYAVLLSVLHQLALQSLAHNRRGVASALVHAWRLARNDPWSTARTVAVDLSIDLVVALLALATTLLLTLVFIPGLAWLPTLGLYGFMGVTRAGYWAQAYRALGGLSPDDAVPGLSGDADPSPVRVPGAGQEW